MIKVNFIFILQSLATLFVHADLFSPPWLSLNIRLLRAPISTPSILVPIRVSCGPTINPASLSQRLLWRTESLKRCPRDEGGGGGDWVTPPGLVPLASNGCSPLYAALCTSITANGTKQNPITGEQTGGLSAALVLYCFNHGANGALVQLERYLKNMFPCLSLKWPEMRIKKKNTSDVKSNVNAS